MARKCLASRITHATVRRDQGSAGGHLNGNKKLGAGQLVSPAGVNRPVSRSRLYMSITSADGAAAMSNSSFLPVAKEGEHNQSASCT
eukprot:scaffold61486_cov28-Tisochrysis_lutea.AAC.4